MNFKWVNDELEIEGIPSQINLTNLLESIEYGFLSYAKHYNKKNTDASRSLGLARTTFVMKCQRYGILRKKNTRDH